MAEAGETLALPDLLARICRLTTEVVPCDRCAIYLWNDRHQAFVPAADHGTPPHLVPRFASRYHYPGRIALEEELRAGGTLVLTRDDPKSDDGLRALAEAEAYALVVVPLPARGATVGSLTLAMHAPPAPDADALAIAETIARQAAPLIENAKLFRRLEKIAAFRAQLVKLAAALDAQAEPALVARLACTRGAALFDVDTGAIFCRRRDALVVLEVSGPGRDDVAAAPVPLDDDGLVARAFRDCRTLFANDVAGGASAALVGRLAAKAVLAMPLVGRDGPVGCLVYADTTRPHAFSQAVADEGRLLAGIVNTAVERAYYLEAAEARRLAEREAAELSRQTAELTEARNAALEAARTKAAFVANMSHEIRTPMTAILGYVNVLAHPDTTPEQRESHLRTIRRNGEHLLRILNDILDLSKIEAGKMTVERVPCSPVEIVGEVASLMQPRAVEKGLDFELRWNGEIPSRIRADATRLRQILINLVGNAIKFTTEGTVRLSVALQRGERPMLRFDVADTGIGLGPQAQAKLFEPFTQADASMTRRFGGTGLGLAISKRLAQMLGGDIVVRSTLGTGSTFTLTVDTGALDGVAMVADPGALPAPDDVVQAAGAGGTLEARVLLAEDTRDNQELFAFILESCGAEVEIADNGRVARDLALEAAAAGRPFDVVLMDMQMPELDGEEATAQLRAAGYRGKIVALTAHAMQSDREKCLRAGCDDFVSKPVDPDVLLATVRRHLSGAPPRPGAVVSTLVANLEIAGLVAMFVDGLPARVAALEDRLAAADVEGITKLAHQLKGTAGGYGFAPITEAAAALEASGRAGAGLDVIRQQMRRVTELCRRARAATPPAEAHPA